MAGNWRKRRRSRESGGPGMVDGPSEPGLGNTRQTSGDEDDPGQSPPALQSLVAGTAERFAVILEAAERAASGVIDEAENQARQYLEEVKDDAERIVSERLRALADLTDSLVAQADAVKEQSEQLSAALDATRRKFESADQIQLLPNLADGDKGAEDSTLRHVPHLQPVESHEQGQQIPGEGTSAGARLLATQMAVSGSSREEIEARLRSGFEIEDTAAILDAILGPED